MYIWIKLYTTCSNILYSSSYVCIPTHTHRDTYTHRAKFKRQECLAL